MLHLLYATFTLSYIYTFAGECGKRRGPRVGCVGRAAERGDGDGCVSFGHFGGRNSAYSHASENMSVECDFSAFCRALAV